MTFTKEELSCYMTQSDDKTARAVLEIAQLATKLAEEGSQRYAEVLLLGVTSRQERKAGRQADPKLPGYLKTAAQRHEVMMRAEGQAWACGVIATKAQQAAIDLGLLPLRCDEDSTRTPD